MQRRPFIQSLIALWGIRPSLSAAASLPETSSADAPTGASDPSLSSLEEWLRFPIQPVWRRPDLEILDAPDPPFNLLLLAIRFKTPITIRYRGGSQPGSDRLISPALVFIKLKSAPVDLTSEPHYVLAWCHLRNELRTFRLDRIGFPESDNDDFPRRLYP